MDGQNLNRNEIPSYKTVNCRRPPSRKYQGQALSMEHFLNSARGWFRKNPVLVERRVKWLERKKDEIKTDFTWNQAEFTKLNRIHILRETIHEPCWEFRLSIGFKFPIKFRCEGYEITNEGNYNR